MRKSFVLVLILTGLSAALLISAFGRLNQYKDAVSVSETVLEGSKDKAYGIRVTNKTQCEYHMFWDTVYTVGAELDVKTQYRFSQSQQREERIMQDHVSLYCPTDFGMGGTSLDFSERNIPEMPLKPAIDVASRTQNGETRDEIICLRDYYEFYPVAFEMYWARDEHIATNEAYMLQILDYFKIPVPEAHMIKVSVTKDLAGNITNVNTSTVSGATVLYADGILTEQGCYFAVSATDGDTGELVELPFGLSGIHFLPFTKQNDMFVPDTAGLKLVYPVDSRSIRTLRLLQSPDGSSLLLFAKEPGGITLFAIDKASLRLLGRTQLEASDAELWEVKQHEDYMLALFSGGDFALLTPASQGDYEIQLRGNLFACEQLSTKVPYYEMMTDYDGERLAVAFYQEMYMSGSTYLLVFTSDGLAYAGKYDQSTDRTPGTSPVRPLEYEPLSISCG